MSRRTPAHPKPRPRTARRIRDPRSRRVRIVVADSQSIDRGGLVGLLEDERDFEVIGESATVEQTIVQCRALRPDVLVLSLNLSGQEKDAAIPAVRTALPSLRIVALSERGWDNCLVLNPPARRRTPAERRLGCNSGVDCLQLAVTQGAMATLRRSADPEELFQAIRAVSEGIACYDAMTAAGLLSRARSRNGEAEGVERGRPLTAREREVAALIAEGQSNKEISTSLRISEPTVKKHVGRILEKLGLADRLQVGLYLARNPLALRG